MATFMLLFTFASLFLIIPLMMGHMKHEDMHRIDLMAGDEGDN